MNKDYTQSAHDASLMPDMEIIKQIMIYFTSAVLMSKGILQITTNSATQKKVRAKHKEKNHKANCC